MPEALFDSSSHVGDGRFSRAGRGTVVMFRHENRRLVLKTYQRGGVPGRFVRDSYFYTGIEKTRMWQEFHLLQTLHAMGLPVPRPVAARCVLTTPFTYRGELVMEEIAGCRTLVDVLNDQPLAPETWRSIGKQIAEFHHHGIYHGDLNASNILLSQDGSVHLVDFDKSAIRSRYCGQTHGWQSANLARLLRSLQKFARRFGCMNFTSEGWQGLMIGYRKARQRLGETALVWLIADDLMPLVSALL